jgi:uncharacterized protein (TIGR02271 family)
MSQAIDNLPSDSEVKNILFVSGELNPTSSFTELRLSEGRTIRLRTEMLLEGSFLKQGTASSSEQGETLIPIVEESLVVTKRTVETGKIRLYKDVQEFQVPLNETLAIRTFDVERVVLNCPVETAPEVRKENGTTIYSLVEEQMVLTKQLILREEIRVTQRDTERVDTQIVTLRRDRMEIERAPTTQE